MKWIDFSRISCYFVLLTLVTFQVHAQSQWASSVIGYSSCSNAGKKQQFKPEQALGKPNKLPATGGAATAWTPQNDNEGMEYIHVGFTKAQKAQQIAIAENFHPGSIVLIQAYDTLGNEHVLYDNATPALVKEEGRMFYHFFPLTTFAIKSLKVTLNTQLVAGSNQIDAIGISASNDSLKAIIHEVKSTEKIEPKVNLGEAINSATDDLLPVISPNGKTLYFTRQSHPNNIAPIGNQDIWYSTISEQGDFSTAQNIGEPLNNSENNATASITPDGQRMLVLNVYNPNGTMAKGISLSHFNGTSWGFPQKMIIDSFYNDNIYGEYMLSNSGKFLVMTLERNDSEGLKDLYVSFSKTDGTWTAPKRMGNILNSAESETSPFLCADEKTLYFSSKGRSGYGSNDMFVTHRLDDTWENWTEPENLGNAINTSGWDAYFSLPANGEYAYYVSYSNSLGGADIFRQKLPNSAKPTPVALVSGQVLHAKTLQPLRAKVTYKNLTNGSVLGEGFSDSITGLFQIVLPAGFKYAIIAEKNEYYSVNETIDLTKLKAYEEQTKNIYLVPIEVGETARLNNLFFDFNKADLKPESFIELDQLVQLMMQKPTMEIQIAGHTDDVGEVAYNLDLSQRRAKAVANYLKSKGIEAGRISYKGYGESKPLAKGISDADRQLNRRVEFLILKK